MYRIIEKQATVSIPPSKLGEDYGETIAELTRLTYEGFFDDHANLFILISEVVPVGQGHIVHADANVYQNVSFNALVYTPKLHEVVNGEVVEILKFGAFIRFGPMEGLLHISQVLDERVNVDLGNGRLIGEESTKELKVGDRVRVRIVTLSINERNPNHSRIGFTMRQPGLGKLEWLDQTRKEAEEREKEAKMQTNFTNRD